MIMTEIDVGYGYGCVVESGQIVDQSGGCPDTIPTLLLFEYENKNPTGSDTQTPYQQGVHKGILSNLKKFKHDSLKHFPLAR